MTYDQWFRSQQGVAYEGSYLFAEAAWDYQAERLRELEAHNAVLREALETTHDLYAHASSGYGFARPDNPHNFSPDFECCSQEEIAAHSKACEDYDADRKISNESWGIGTYCDEYAPALKALPSTPESSLADIRRAEWQPIETAPKDVEVFIGRFIDGAFQFGKAVCFYEPGNEFEGEFYGEWFWSIDDVSESVAENPTHWMPLPNPPAIRQMED